ncbi:MAG: hypothetical protein CO141_01625 [Candidatus Moranbacteria bacterium CG_4_9_14_3_um_filter_42_9]|nr:MAG: hypothetical protein CO141_01625 [Candidatus Moranbacteria bacterium CG_4_9_14_3_um_filter_42_9]
MRIFTKLTTILSLVRFKATSFVKSLFKTRNVLVVVSLFLVIGSGFLLYKSLTPKRILTQSEFVAQSKSLPVENKPAIRKVFLNSTPDLSFSMAEINNLSRFLYGTYTAPPAKYSVKKYKVKYTSLDQSNKEITIYAQFYIPGVEMAQSFPVYIFGQGTTGLGDTCAPSKEQPRYDNWGDYQTHMLSYASQGYIVMFPDYEGFNDPGRIHHYFNAQLEAHVLLDGAKATFELLNSDPTLLVKPKDAVFFAGYSQGGHAVFAVSDVAASYAPEVPIKGVIGDGPTTDIAALLRENPILSPYLIYSYSDLYGKDQIDPAQILLPSLLENLALNVKSLCIGKISNAYSSNPRKIFNDKFYSALFNNTLEQDFPEINKLFNENNSGLLKSSVPGLVLQGTADPIVTVKSQKEFVRKSCAVGNSITYYEYPSVHHYRIRQASIKDTLNWMDRIIEGKIPVSSCAGL